MTDLVREQVLEEMARQGISQRRLAETINISPHYLWDMLSGRRSSIPGRWAQVLDALGLEIVVRPKRAEG